jgi:hypothetical protein
VRRQFVVEGRSRLDFRFDGVTQSAEMLQAHVAFDQLRAPLVQPRAPLVQPRGSTARRSRSTTRLDRASPFQSRAARYNRARLNHRSSPVRPQEIQLRATRRHTSASPCARISALTSRNAAA